MIFQSFFKFGENFGVRMLRIARPQGWVFAEQPEEKRRREVEAMQRQVAEQQMRQQAENRVKIGAIRLCSEAQTGHLPDEEET